MDKVLGSFLLPTKEKGSGGSQVLELHGLWEGPQPFPSQQTFLCPLWLQHLSENKQNISITRNIACPQQVLKTNLYNHDLYNHKTSNLRKHISFDVAFFLQNNTSTIPHPYFLISTSCFLRFWLNPCLCFLILMYTIERTAWIKLAVDIIINKALKDKNCTQPVCFGKNQKFTNESTISY